MKKTLERLWYEYMFEESAAIDTEEQRMLMKQTSELSKKAYELLNDEQQDAVENYVDSLCDLEALLAKKAFIKGCEFAVSFILEAGNLKNRHWIMTDGVGGAPDKTDTPTDI